MPSIWSYAGRAQSTNVWYRVSGLRRVSSLSPCAELSSSSLMLLRRESCHSLESCPPTPSSLTRGGIVPAGIGQQCPPLSLLRPVPANERCSLLSTPHINGDLVNAHWAALGGCCNHHGQRQLQLLPPLLRFLSSIVFAPPPDSSSRSVLSVPDGGPSCTPTLRCWS